MLQRDGRRRAETALLHHRRHSAGSAGRLRRLIIGIYDPLGPPGMALAALIVAVAGWLIVAGVRLPKPGTWEHALVAGFLLAMFLAALLIGCRQRRDLEEARRHAQRRSDKARQEAERLCREADALLPQARAGWARRHAARARRTRAFRSPD
jgi:type VI protein secretion system component VasK